MVIWTYDFKMLHLKGHYKQWCCIFVHFFFSQGCGSGWIWPGSGSNLREKLDPDLDQTFRENWTWIQPSPKPRKTTRFRIRKFFWECWILMSRPDPTLYPYSSQYAFVIWILLFLSLGEFPRVVTLYNMILIYCIILI